MKVLIWIGCIFLFSVIQALLNGNRPMGAIPTIIVYGVMFAVAHGLCKAWDRHKLSKLASDAAHTVPDPDGSGPSTAGENPAGQAGSDATEHETVSAEQPAASAAQDAPEAEFCRQCGYRLLDGSAFCSKCGAEVAKGELV